MKLPRLQILTSLLAPPQELRYEHGRKLTEYLPSDVGTADEFLAVMAGGCDMLRRGG
jgi:hypothetical protein